MKRLRVLLLLHVLFFGGWAGYLFASSAGGQPIWIETLPVDPRDLIAGHYVALRFPIEHVTSGSCATFIDNAKSGELYVRLEPGDLTVSAGGRSVTPWQAIDCAKRPPDSAGGAGSADNWARADISGHGLRYGIERFYVAEDNPLRQASSGQVIARVSLGRDHRLRIVELVSIDGAQ